MRMGLTLDAGIGKTARTKARPEPEPLRGRTDPSVLARLRTRWCPKVKGIKSHSVTSASTVVEEQDGKDYIARCTLCKRTWRTRVKTARMKYEVRTTRPSKEPLVADASLSDEQKRIDQLQQEIERRQLRDQLLVAIAPTMPDQPAEAVLKRVDELLEARRHV